MTSDSDSDDSCFFAPPIFASSSQRGIVADDDDDDKKSNDGRLKCNESEKAEVYSSSPPPEPPIDTRGTFSSSLSDNEEWGDDSSDGDTCDRTVPMSPGSISISPEGSIVDVQRRGESSMSTLSYQERTGIGRAHGGNSTETSVGDEAGESSKKAETTNHQQLHAHFPPLLVAGMATTVATTTKTAPSPNHNGGSDKVRLSTNAKLNNAPWAAMPLLVMVPQLEVATNARNIKTMSPRSRSTSKIMKSP